MVPYVFITIKTKTGKGTVRMRVSTLESSKAKAAADKLLEGLVPGTGSMMMAQQPMVQPMMAQQPMMGQQPMMMGQQLMMMAP